MKKYKDIKIIKEKSSNNNNNCTFIDDANISKPDKIHLMYIKEVLCCMIIISKYI